jgi:hypothetical protein
MSAVARRVRSVGIDHHLQLPLDTYRTRTVLLPFGPEPLEASTINSEYYNLLIDPWRKADRLGHGTAFQTNLGYTRGISSNRTVNKPRLGYKNQSVNAV